MPLLLRWMTPALALGTVTALCQAQKSSISGRIRHDDGAFAAGAQVLVDSATAPVICDDSGRFHIDRLSAGPHTITVRQIGYTPVQGFFHADRAESITRNFTLARTAEALPSVVIVGEAGERLPPKLTDFERRRSQGIGKFLGPSDLAKHDGELPGSVLARTMTGMTLQRGSGQAQYPVSTRGQGGVRGQGPMGCPVTVYVDGALSSDRYFNVNAMQIGELAGIEFYRGIAEVPAQYSRAGTMCGVLLLWTK